MNRISIFLIVAVMLVGGVSAYSHHSAVAIYDVSDEAEIQGELVQISLRNPHSYVYVNAPDAEGEMRRWGIEWGGARQLTEQGAAAAFKVGDEVVVIGNPGRNVRDRRLLMVSIVRPSGWIQLGPGLRRSHPGHRSIEEGKEVRMKLRISERRRRLPLVGAMMCLVFLVTTASDGYAAQRGLTPDGPPTPRRMAPFDVTGYWVAVITEDWRVRMITPPRGDFLSIPLNDAGIEMALAWDPEADIANGLECQAFGAAAIMRMPTRIHITWDDDDTLRFDFDYGQQTRLAHFDASTPLGERSWQGQAVAEWINTEQPRGRGAAPPDPSQRPGGLQIVTTNLLPQYQRQNGIPVSEDAVVLNIIDLVTGPGDQDWLIVKTEIDDPEYMTAARTTSVQFRREPDDSNWYPEPCQVELPPTPRIPVQR